MSTTMARAHRDLVAEMDAEGVRPAEIASRLGISVDRVEAILDQLDEDDGRGSHPDDESRAPAVEPVAASPRPPSSGPIVVGSPARAARPIPAVRPVPDWPAEAEPAEPARETEPEPDPVRSEPRPTAPTPEPVKPAERPAAVVDPPPLAERAERLAEALAEGRSGVTEGKPGVRVVREHGTAKGARQHWTHKDTPLCEPCKDAYNAEHRTAKAASRKASTPAPAATIPKAKFDPAPLAPPPAKPGPVPREVLPDGAVALLSLPLTVPALVAVADALELAYGPDLRVSAGPSGCLQIGGGGGVLMHEFIGDRNGGSS